MRIVVNDKGVFINGERVGDRPEDGADVYVEQTTHSGNRVTVNDREVTGFWGGCIAAMTAFFGLCVAGLTLLGVALMLASPILILVGLGWLISEAIN